MKIEDFNNLKPFDKVWLMHKNLPVKTTVDHVILIQSQSEPVEVYVYSDSVFRVKHTLIFNTKAELLTHVFGFI